MGEDEKVERVVEVLYPGFEPQQFEIVRHDGTAVPGFKFHLGYDWVPPGSRGAGMDRDRLGYTVEVVTDSNGIASVLLPPNAEKSRNRYRNGSGDDMVFLNNPPWRSAEPTGVWIWPEERHTLLGLKIGGWSDRLSIEQELNFPYVKYSREALTVFADTNAARVTVRLVGTSPLPLGKRYLLSAGLSVPRSVLAGKAPNESYVDSIPFESGCASFAAPMGSAGPLRLAVGEYDAQLLAVRDDHPSLVIDRSIELPKDQKDVELIIDVAGGVKLAGKAVTPSGKPAIGISFMVDAMATVSGQSEKVESKETSVTNVDGEFEVLLHSAEEYVLTVAPRRDLPGSPPYHLADYWLHLTPKQVLAGPLSVEVIPSGVLWGQVVGADGTGLPGFKVDALRFNTDTLRRSFRSEAATDGAGYFTIDLTTGEAGMPMLLWAERGNFVAFGAAEISSGEKSVLKALPCSDIPLPVDIVDTKDITVSFRVPGMHERMVVGGLSDTHAFSIYSFRPEEGPMKGRTWVSAVPVGADAEILVNGKPIIRVLPDPAGDKPGSFVAQELPRGELY